MALLIARLRSIDVAAPLALPTLVPLLREVIGAKRALAYQVEPAGTVAVTSVGFERPHELAEAFARWHACARGCVADDAAEPRASQRNLVVAFPPIRDRLAAPDDDTLTPRALEGLAQALAPWGADGDHVSRIQVCDGGAVLGWLGVLLPRPATARENLILGAIAPALRERLMLERRLTNSACHEAALDAALDAVSGAAYVIRADGTLLRANAAGKLALDREGARLRASLVAALRGGDPSYAVKALGDGALGYALVVDKEPARVQAGVRETTVARFGLTPRQTEVLELLVQGHANREIAALLGCAERTVEVHISQIFEKTGVATRTALIARIWQLAS